MSLVLFIHFSYSDLSARPTVFEARRPEINPPVAADIKTFMRAVSATTTTDGDPHTTPHTNDYRQQQQHHHSKRTNDDDRAVICGIEICSVAENLDEATATASATNGSTSQHQPSSRPGVQLVVKMTSDSAMD